MIPVTCYKLQGFSFSYKRYERIPIPYLNYMQQPNIV